MLQGLLSDVVGRNARFDDLPYFLQLSRQVHLRAQGREDIAVLPRATRSGGEAGLRLLKFPLRIQRERLPEQLVNLVFRGKLLFQGRLKPRAVEGFAYVT